MLDLQVTVKGENVVLLGLRRFGERLPEAVRSGLTRAAKGVHRAAYAWLSGSGAKASGVPAGGYPVPVRTGNLRRLLDWLGPGESRTAGGQSFQTGPMEAMVFDSALYSHLVHDGGGSSAEHGRRPFLEDALDEFNRGDRVRGLIEEEIAREIGRCKL